MKNKTDKRNFYIILFTNSMQYTLLRELLINDLVETIPDYNTNK